MEIPVLMNTLEPSSVNSFSRTELLQLRDVDLITRYFVFKKLVIHNLTNCQIKLAICEDDSDGSFRPRATAKEESERCMLVKLH